MISSVEVVISLLANDCGSTTSFFKTGLNLNTKFCVLLGVTSNFTSSFTFRLCGSIRVTWALVFLTIPVILVFITSSVWSFPAVLLVKKTLEDATPAFDVARPIKSDATFKTNRLTVERSNSFVKAAVADAVIVPPTETRDTGSPVLNWWPGI